MRAVLIVAVLALAGCGTPRLMSYGVELSDAKVLLPDGGAFSVYVHPKDPTILIENRIAQSGRAQSYDIGIWRSAAESFVKPIGCGISEVKNISAGAWEAAYACPPGVDLRGLAMAQRRELQGGAPLHR